MPWSALPEHINTPEEWKGTDHDTKWMRWMLYTKGWTAFGPRAKEWWAKWREFPKTLFAIRSNQGIFRVESEGWERDSAFDGIFMSSPIVNQDIWLSRPHDQYVETFERGYLSRCQKYTRWSIQIQWPFLVAVHWYSRAEDVPKWGNPVPSGFADGKIWFVYFGAHRDADKVYMFPSAYIGRNWK